MESNDCLFSCCLLGHCCETTSSTSRQMEMQLETKGNTKLVLLDGSRIQGCELKSSLLKITRRRKSSSSNIEIRTHNVETFITHVEFDTLSDRFMQMRRKIHFLSFAIDTRAIRKMFRDGNWIYSWNERDFGVIAKDWCGVSDRKRVKAKVCWTWGLWR